MKAREIVDIGRLVQEAFHDWERQLNDDESHFVRYYGEIQRGFTPPEAFAAIPVLSKMIRERLVEAPLNKFVCEEMAQFLAILVMRSGTTELPSSFEQDFAIIDEAFRTRGFDRTAIDDIRWVYRMN